MKISVAAVLLAFTFMTFVAGAAEPTPAKPVTSVAGAQSDQDPSLTRAREATLVRAQAVAQARADRDDVVKAQRQLDLRTKQASAATSAIQSATSAQTVAEKKLVEALRDLARAQSASQKAEAALANATASKEASKKKSFSAKASAAAKEVLDAQAVIRKITTAIETAKHARVAAAETLTSANRDLAQAKAEAANKNASWAQSEAAAEQARQAERTARAPIDRANRERAREMAAAIARAAYDLDNTNVAKEDAQSSAKNARQKKSATDALLALAQKQVTSAHAALDRSQAAVGALTDALNRNPPAPSETRVKATAQLNAANASYQTTKAAAEAAATRAQKSSEDLKAAPRLREKAQTRLTDANNALKAAEADAKKVRQSSRQPATDKKVTAADGAVIVQKERVALATAELAQVKAEQRDLPARAKADQADVKRLRDAVAAKEKDLTRAKAANAAIPKTKAERDLAAATAALNDARSEVKTAEAALAIAVKAAAAAADASTKAEANARRALDASSRANAEREENSRRANSYHVMVPESPKNSPNMNSLYGAAPWGEDSEHRVWTDIVVATIRANIDRLEMARDKEDFCPDYRDATEHEREVCWLRIVGGVSRYESNFKSSDGFKEPSGQMSVGLLALSPNECKEYQTEHLLKNGVLNLSCGVAIMAHLIERDGFINGPETSRGAAAYWSVLREPYTYGDYNLGKKFKIMEITKRYREF